MKILSPTGCGISKRGSSLSSYYDNDFRVWLFHQVVNDLILQGLTEQKNNQHKEGLLNDIATPITLANISRPYTSAIVYAFSTSSPLAAIRYSEKGAVQLV